MMQADVRVTITATSNGVTAIRRNEPMPAGAVNQGELLDKADFRPMTSGKVKEATALGGIVLKARAPRWALNPITAQAHAPQGSIVITKTGGDTLGQWGSIGIRPAFEWCLILPKDIRLTSDPMEVSGTLVAFLPNGGDVDKNVRDVISKCTIADIDRVRAIYTRLAEQSEDAANRASKDSPPPISKTGGSSAPTIPGPRGAAPPPPPGPGGARPGGPPPPPSRGGPPSTPPPRITPPRPTS